MFCICCWYSKCWCRWVWFAFSSWLGSYWPSSSEGGMKLIWEESCWCWRRACCWYCFCKSSSFWISMFLVILFWDYELSFCWFSNYCWWNYRISIF
jgi:hypothetical protein